MKRRLNPDACEVCGARITGWPCMTYMYGKWRCPDCQEKAKKKPQKYYIDELNNV